MDSVVGTAHLGRYRIDIFRKAVERLQCDGTAKHVRPRASSRLRHHGMGFGRERRIGDIRLRPSSASEPVVRRQIVDAARPEELHDSSVAIG